MGIVGDRLSNTNESPEDWRREPGIEKRRREAERQLMWGGARSTDDYVADGRAKTGVPLMATPYTATEWTG